MNNNGHNRVVRVIAVVLGTCAVLESAFYVTSAAPRLNMVIGTLQYVSLGASFLLPLPFLLMRANGKAPKDKVPWYDVIAAILSFLVPLVMFFNDERARIGMWGMFPPKPVLVAGITMCILVAEGSRRAAGNFFAGAVVVLGLAPIYVHLLPGFLKGRTVDLDRLIGVNFTTSHGMFGTVMQTFILVYLLFIFFGVATQLAGAGEFFTNLSISLLRNARGASGKVAVIASSLFGTISGSASANVSVCGSFTIPMMKRGGYSPHFAAAVEAASSEGGILMPPVMGAVAFIMANFLGIPYWRVALAALVPAVLYYVSLFAQVHFHAVNHGLGAVELAERPTLRKALLQGWHIIVAALILVWLLFIVKMNAGQSALLATVALFALTMIRKSTRPSSADISKLAGDSAKVFGHLGPVLLAIGIIVAGIDVSGLGMSFTQWLRAGQSPFAALLSLAVIAFVLGTAMPVAAVYMLLAVLMGPALESFGLNRIAVHMTILYWGVMSDFTPPTAIGPTIAAGYAGASPMKTCLQAMRLAGVIYIAPFFFIFHPVLLFEDFQIVPFVFAVSSGVVGLLLLARAFEGYGPPGNGIKRFKRLTSLVASLLFLSMIWYLVVAGVVLAVVILLSGRAEEVLERRLRSRAKLPQIPT